VTKTIISGTDTKTNLRVHASMMLFLNNKQQQKEENDTHLKCFKSNVETLKIAGGNHMLVSPEMTGKTLTVANTKEVTEELEHFKAMCFILRADDSHYKKLLDDLKNSAYRGRDEYPKTLIAAYDFLVRESGAFDSNNSRQRSFHQGGR